MSRKITFSIPSLPSFSFFSSPEKLLKISLAVLGIGFILMVMALLIYFNDCSCPAKASKKETTETVSTSSAKTQTKIATTKTTPKKSSVSYSSDVNQALSIIDRAELSRLKEANTKASSWKTSAKLFNLFVYMSNLSNQQPYLSYDYYYDQGSSDTISVNFYSNGKVEAEEETTSYDKIKLDLTSLPLSTRKVVELALDTHLVKYPDFKVEALFITIYGGDNYWSVEIGGSKDPETLERPEYNYRVSFKGEVEFVPED